VPVEAAPQLDRMRITLEVRRASAIVVHEQVKVADLRRTPDELLGWLCAALEFPVGVVLLTGTATVPDPEFTLHPEDEVVVAIDGVGVLRNVVERVGEPR
jgi:2-dehydro-3-deoxy-D-arabinonate dehydratase